MILKISLRAKGGVAKTLLEQKHRLNFLYFPQNTLMLTESREEFSDLHSIFRLRALRYLKAAHVLHKDFSQQSRVQRHSLLFLAYMSHSEWFESASQKFPHKIFFQSVAKMETAVRETLDSILSWLPSFTRPFIRRSLLLDW